MADRGSSKRSSQRVFNKEEIESELDETLESTEVQGTPHAEDGAQQGISNHPAAEEDEEQRKLPPRNQPPTNSRR